MANVVTQLIVDARGAEEGSAAYVRAMKAAQSAADATLDREAKLQGAIDKTVVTLSRGAGSIDQVGRRWNQLIATIDPVAAAQQKAAKAIEDATLRADAAVRRLGVSQQEAARAVEAVRAKYEAATAEVVRATSAANDNSQALARMRAQYDPIFAAQLKHKEALEGISEAERAGAITTDLATTARRAALSVMNDTIQKLERMAQAQKDAAQRSVNQQLIVPDRGGDIAEYARELDALQAKFDPLFRAEQAYISTVEELDRALAVGAISQEVYNARFAEQGEILDQAVAKINGVAEAQEKVTSVTETAAQAQARFNSLLGVRVDFGSDGRAADIEAYANALDAVRAKYVPLARAQQAYEGGLEEVRRAQDAGALSADEAAAANLRLTRTYQDQVQSLERVAAAQKASAQRQVDQQTITPDRAADIEAYGKSLDDLQAKFDPLFAAERQFKATEDEINAAARTGALTEQQRVKALEQAAARFNNQRIEIEKTEQSTARLTRGVGLNAYQWQNLSFQVNDVVTSLGCEPNQAVAGSVVL